MIGGVSLSEPHFADIAIIIGMHICVFLHTCICVCAYIDLVHGAQVRDCKHVCMCVCVCVCACMRAYVHVCVIY